MKRASRACLLMLLAGLLGSHAAGQAAPDKPAIAQQYKQSFLPLGPEQAPRSQDARLQGVFVDKIASCYTAETGAPLPDKSRTLLVEFAPELVLQFAAAWKGSGCEPGKPASEACLQQVSALACEPFAAVIRAQGWDRAPSPAMEAAIAKYTDRLAGRYVACRAGGKQDVEVTAIRSEHLAKRAAVQIAMWISTGQCSLIESGLQHCVEQIAAPDACEGLVEAEKSSRLPRFCSEFVDCSAEPAIVQKIAK